MSNGFYKGAIMTTEKSKVNDKDQICQLIDDWANAVRTKDADSVVSNYAPEVVSFDIAPPLRQRIGIDEYKKGLEAWFSTFQDSIGYEICELEIAVGSDLAFAHSIIHLSGKRKSADGVDIKVQEGEDTGGWMRLTLGFHKIDGKWMIAHEHSSVPMRMDGSNKAAIDLKP
jgi:ketosteroid isomerase-like protein